MIQLLPRLTDDAVVRQREGIAALALYESAVECGAARSGAERRRRTDSARRFEGLGEIEGPRGGVDYDPPP